MIRGLDSLFDAKVVLHFGGPAELGRHVSPFPEEEHAIARAVEQRRAQYRATRLLARRAFGELGIDAAPVLNRDDRSPIWPGGVVGSLTHTTGFCAVAVARNTSHTSLGIDAEYAERLSHEVIERVLTEQERTAAGMATSEENRFAALVFSAKESVYKCQFPLTARFLGFHDVEIDVDFVQRRFRPRFLVEPASLPAASRFEGRFTFHDDHVVTAVSYRDE